jgi:hypothetical protein
VGDRKFPLTGDGEDRKRVVRFGWTGLSLPIRVAGPDAREGGLPLTQRTAGDTDAASPGALGFSHHLSDSKLEG